MGVGCADVSHTRLRRRRSDPTRRRFTPDVSGTAAATPLQTNVDIVVDGNRIKSVEPHKDGQHVGTVVDAANETVIPGLIEIHTHLSKDFGEALGRIFLAWGSRPSAIPRPTRSRRSSTAKRSTRARASARASSPPVQPFDGTRIYYPGGMSVDDTGQLPLALQRAKDADFDFVKTYVRLPDLMQKRIVEEAHRMGMPVTSHELYPAVAFGADGVEHIRGTSRRGYSPKISGLSRSYQDVIDLLTASKMTLTPTIGIQGGFRLQTLRDASWIDDPRMKLYPPAVPQRWREQTRTPASAEAIEQAAHLVAPQEKTVVSGGQRRRPRRRRHRLADQSVRARAVDGDGELRVGRTDAGRSAAHGDDACRPRRSAPAPISAASSRTSSPTSRSSTATR